MEFEAKKLLMERLDKNLLHHARELFELAKPEQPQRRSLQEQIRAATKEARQQPVQEERPRGGGER